MTEKKTVVLAFSGGLDTSYCVLALREQGFEVHTVFVDTGGIEQEEIDWIEERARSLGSAKHHLVDVSQAIWDEFVTPLVWSHARMLGEYPLLCSDRYLIVKRCLELCDELGTTHFAHGCTGMGNDQLRFDQTVRSIGDYSIHAPVRASSPGCTSTGHGADTLPSTAPTTSRASCPASMSPERTPSIQVWAPPRSVSRSATCRIRMRAPRVAAPCSSPM